MAVGMGNVRRHGQCGWPRTDGGGWGSDAAKGRSDAATASLLTGHTLREAEIYTIFRF
jgi:hypothetical protein